jgi:hypothetical protein
MAQHLQSQSRLCQENYMAASLLCQRPLAFIKLVTAAAVSLATPHSPAASACITRPTQRRPARSQLHLTHQQLWLALPGQCRGHRQDQLQLTHQQLRLASPNFIDSCIHCLPAHLYIRLRDGHLL